MTRTTPSLLAACVAALLLAGCGGGEEESGQPAGGGGDRTEPAAEAPATDEGMTAESDSAPTDETAAGDDGTGSGDTAGQTARGGQETAGDSEAAATEPAAEGEPASADSDVPPGKAAAQSLGCTSCHQADAKLVGPPYRAVAERYDGDKATILKRMQKAVSQGAQGSWTDVTGGAPMPPQPQAAQQTEKLDKIAEWIAGMK